MKKFVALLVALLCLLMGSALAVVNVSFCGTEYPVSATPSYLKVSEAGALTNGSASNYNVKFELQNGGIVVTFKNANIQCSTEILLNGNGSVPLTVIGEGKNTLKSTMRGNSALRSVSDIELKGSFDTIAGADAAITSYSNGNIRVNANIQNLGQSDGNTAILSRNGGIIIGGNIGSIRAAQMGMYAPQNIQIDGAIGQIDVLSNGWGIFSYNGKLIINNSVGPINMISTKDDGIAAFGYKGIALGEGVSLLAPKGGRILGSKDAGYNVCDKNGNISTVAQFVKATASAPATGDGMNIALWVSLLTVSMIGIAILSRKAKREY